MNKSVPAFYPDHSMGVAIKAYRLKNKHTRLHNFVAAVLTITLIITVIFGILYCLKTANMPAAPAMTAETAIAIPAVPEAPAEIKKEVAAAIPESPYEAIPSIPGVPRIILDPGHGGADSGCVREGTIEKDVNLEIAKLLEAKLTGDGYQVIMTRSEDVDMTVEERVEKANYYQGDAFVSIHQNAYEGTDADGIEVWYQGDDSTRDNKRLAQIISQQTVESTGANARNLWEESEFYVTNNTVMPSCLIETGFLSNRLEREKLLDPEYQNQIADGLAQGIKSFCEPKTMYLTFDDGPDGENTEKILDILNENNVKATFFVIGEYVRKYPDITRRIVAEGHAIGIHCDVHDYGNLYQSAESYLEDFEKARQTVLEVTGTTTNLFRFPGGSINAYNKAVHDDIIETMTAKGYVYFDWNAGLEDTLNREVLPEKLIEMGVSSTLGRKKIVFLAHDTVDNTVLCLDELLYQFPEYRMDVLTTEVEPIQF